MTPARSREVQLQRCPTHGLTESASRYCAHYLAPDETCDAELEDAGTWVEVGVAIAAINETAERIGSDARAQMTAAFDRIHAELAEITDEVKRHG